MSGAPKTRIGFVVIRTAGRYSGEETVVSSGNKLYTTAARAIIDNALDFQRDEEDYQVAAVYTLDNEEDLF